MQNAVWHDANISEHFAYSRINNLTDTEETYRHDHSVAALGLRNTSCCDIRIANSLDLENVAVLCDLVEFLVHVL